MREGSTLSNTGDAIYVSILIIFKLIFFYSINISEGKFVLRQLEVAGLNVDQNHLSSISLAAVLVKVV